MRSKHISSCIDNIANAFRRLQQLRMVTTVEVLAVRFVFHRQTEFFSHRADIVFVKSSKWKQQMGKLSLIQTIEKIRLIFRVINATKQMEDTVVFTNSCIMTCCKLLKFNTLISSKLRQNAKFHKGIASDTWIRRLSRQIFCSEIIQHDFFIFVRAVKYMVFNA